jgi:hypothetical protein
MRNFQLALLCFIYVAKSYCQAGTGSYGRIDVEITKEKHPKRIYVKVEIKPAFPGGDSSWIQSIEKNLNQSIKLDKGAKKGKYVVSVQFVVDKDGYLADIRCINDPGFGMCREVLRVIKKSQRWVPGSARPIIPYRT